MTRRELLQAAGTLVIADCARMGAIPNPQSLGERLGHKPEDRLLLIHADDLGMCQSVNAASEKALLDGAVSCASVMVPCPWFPAIAAWVREHPDADVGLHLTLTSEWSYYRWRPVAPPDEVRGLVDEDGFMWRTVAQVKAHAAPGEVEAEIRAQIARARKFGMQPTHVDSHMGTLFSDPRFFDVYVRVSKETGIMPMIPEPAPEINIQAGLLGLDYPKLAGKLKGEGYVLLDHLVTGLEGDTYDDRSKAAREFIRGLRPGVTELIVHLSGNDEEIRQITSSWEKRFNDFRIVTDPEIRGLLREQGVTLLGYRDLKKLWKP